MANLSQLKRQCMLEFLDKIKEEHKTVVMQLMGNKKDRKTKPSMI